jgi:hypothetical protein
MAYGGFDVIVGNPPYVAKQKIDYEIRGSRFPDIYADILMRLTPLSDRHARLGMIVPLSMTFSGDFAALRTKATSQGASWFSSFDNIPAAVFSGVSQRCTIWLCGRQDIRQVFVAPMARWRSEYRPHLVVRIVYTPLPKVFDGKGGLPKLASTSGYHEERSNPCE